MSEYVAYLGNFTVLGCEITKFPDGSFLRDRITLKVAGRELVCTQLPAVIKEYIKNQPRGVFVDSTRIRITNVAESEIPGVREVVDQVTELFSFATESRVVRYGDDHPAEGSLRERRSVNGTVQHWRTPFNGTDDLRRFVETGYPNYVALRGPRQLHVVIDYIHFATMQGLPQEGKLALTFILLEHMVHAFRQANSLPKTTFAADMTAMFGSVGMTVNVTRIKDARNELIHEGLLSTPHEENWKTFEICQSAVREYVLRLLGYTGFFFNYDLSHKTI